MTDAKDVVAMEKGASVGKEPWADTYLKILLLHIDKVTFVKSFLIPSYEALDDLPTLSGMTMFLGVFLLFSFIYTTFTLLTSDLDGNGKIDGFQNIDVVFIMLPCFLFILFPALYFGVMLPKYKTIQTEGRLAALMEIANVKPPYRDHSKPYGYTFYTRALQHVTYTYIVITFTVSVGFTGRPDICFSMAGLMLLFMEPAKNMVDSTWNSTAISDCEVTISGAMQGQIVFAEGESNSMAVNLGALATLSWKDSAVREQLSKAAEQRKGYNFSVFDTSTGYHTTISSEGPKINHEKSTSATKAVMMECREMMQQQLQKAL